MDFASGWPKGKLLKKFFLRNPFQNVLPAIARSAPQLLMRRRAFSQVTHTMSLRGAKRRGNPERKNRKKHRNSSFFGFEFGIAASPF